MLGVLREFEREIETHPRDLPGRPDFVFRGRRIAVFVDGDFWHGWRFPTWQHKLAPFWADKISANRARDRRNHARLRRWGWRVVRVWEHQIKSAPHRVRERMIAVLEADRF
jgi:DNA mismatch endonuclease (patch repair protein)